jgi:hypothetical protein
MERFDGRQFVPECFGDTGLLKSFAIPRRKINHQKSIGNVANAMQKIQAKGDQTDLIIGLIDDDVVKPGYFTSNFNLVTIEHQVKFLEYPSGSQQLVILCPDLEGWLLWVAQLAKVDPGKFKLAKSARELHKQTATVGYDDNAQFQAFLEALHQAQPAPLVHLGQLLAGS